VSRCVVANHAYIWNSPTRSVDEFRHKSAVLDEHCRAVGGDLVEITRSVQVLVSSEEPREGQSHLPQDAEPLIHDRLRGAAWTRHGRLMDGQRETGLEPATSTLGRCRSVSEFALAR
jgi:hypothetical protein